MGRAIDADKIEYYDDEQGFEMAYKVDIDALPTFTPPNEWVSVEDAAPDPGERVLATDGIFVGEAYRSSANSWFRHTGFPWRDGVTGRTVRFWMPLPTPPAKEGRPMKAILLDEAKKWLEENCENQYTRMAVFGIMQSMPAVDYQETPNEPLTQADLDSMDYDKVWIDYEDGTGEWALVCRGYIYSIDTLEGAGFDFVDYMRGERLEPNGYKVYRRPPEGEEAGNG